jgi:Bacterial type III secretion protein (HrpB1_HrpK)
VSTAASPSAAQEPPDSHKILLVRNLIAAMMVGQWHGHTDDVAVILDALSRAFGNSRTLRVNLALASSLRGDLEPAHTLLAEDLDSWPEPDVARITLALALKIGGDASWADGPRRVLSLSTDEAARGFAQRVLDSD